ncbi:polysaccharide deacetylase family protein [Pseudooceanicola sp. 502str34]
MSGPVRDFAGYGQHPPVTHWPGGKRLALVVVVNFEEGAEPSIPDGDPATELALTDGIPGEVPSGTRDLVAESLFEYGSRVGFWRLYEMFRETGVPPTMGLCAQAMRRNPEAAEAIAEAGYDICCHGDRFARHFLMEEAEEAATIARAIDGLTEIMGRAPSGWQSRYAPSIHTRRLLMGHPSILYDADSYADDLPYWVDCEGTDRLVVPHTFTLNDNRLPSGKLGTAEDFLDHLSSAFRVLHAESARIPRLMTISLHNRISGQPARFDAIRRFLDHALSHEDVWFASRGEVARHWAAHHPPEGAA